MPNDLYELVVKRDELLLAEVAAWLHMIGKYQKVPKDIELPKEIETNYEYLFNFFNQVRTQPFGENYRFLDFIEKHRETGNAKKDQSNKYTYIEKLLMDAHGRGSGTDKGIFLDSSYKKQEGNNQYHSSVFGWEEKALDLDLIEKGRFELYSYLDKEVGEMEKKLSNSRLSHDDWKRWRDEFCQRLKKEFSRTIADTRYPINDVSLWDQTASTVAFFKVLLAGSLLCDKSITKNPLKDQARFRVLQVMIGGMDYLSNSVRIADLLFRKSLIKDGFNRVKDLLEVEYPLGCEVYRDMDRIIFLVPDIDDDLLKVEDSQSHKTVETLISESFHEKVRGEIDLNSVRLSEKAARNVFFVGNELIKPVGHYSPTVEFLQKRWQNEPIDRCMVCQISTCGYVDETIAKDRRERDTLTALALKRKICGYCLKRLSGRSEYWLNKQRERTIWLDEVADRNGRVALITAEFTLSKWQNGKMISTQRNITNISITYTKLKDNFKKKDGSPLGNVNGLNEIINKDWREKTIGDFKELMIVNEDLDDYRMEDEEKLALAVWRKTPSFARIRRIWETTRKFWQEILDEFPSSKAVGQRPCRIKIKGEFHTDGPNKLAGFNSYIAEIPQGARFTIVAAADEGEFYVTENLQWLAQKLGAEARQVSQYGPTAGFVREKLEDVDGLNLYEFEPIDRRIGELTKIQTELEEKDYLPAIEILAEPDRFMAIIPAERALEVVTAIKKKYCLEMGKVRNRLPVMVGLVFAESHTPLTALLDAGRRMLKMNVQSQETWEVINKSNNEEKNCVRIEFENRITWDVPTVMGNQTNDIWYPNFYVRDNTKGAKEPRERPAAFKGPHGWLVQVQELEPGDQVIVTPSRFDFEFMTSAALRFEIGYDQETGKRLSGPGAGSKFTRPYYLEELDKLQDLQDILQKGLNRNQIYQMLELIEMKRSEWGDYKDPVFKDFVRDVIRNARWKKELDTGTVDKLTDAGVKGQLRDVVELYFKIVKSDEEVDPNENSGN